MEMWQHSMEQYPEERVYDWSSSGCHGMIGVQMGIAGDSLPEPLPKLLFLSPTPATVYGLLRDPERVS